MHFEYICSTFARWQSFGESRRNGTWALGFDDRSSKLTDPVFQVDLKSEILLQRLFFIF